MDNKDWMMDHWSVHLDIGKALGLAVPELVGYDLRDSSQFYDWMSIHGKMHSDINDALGIRS
jgi:hypothetical protein